VDKIAKKNRQKKKQSEGVRFC